MTTPQSPRKFSIQIFGHARIVKSKTIDGYVTDLPYPSNFVNQFQPPWVDAVLVSSGVVPPRKARGRFTSVDLGCGDGLGLLISAASHPEANFVGIDAMPSHIERGQKIAAEIGLQNIEFRCQTFSEALQTANGVADYVTAQGVLAWVSPENRKALFDLAELFLKPGGAFSVGYNAFPGWSSMLQFQRIIRAMAGDEIGTSSQKLAKALKKLRTANVIEPALWIWFDPIWQAMPKDYFAHEYLNGHWLPCFSGDVIDEMSQRNMDYVAQTSPLRFRDDLVFQPSWCQSLQKFKSASAREMAADELATTSFRHDVYVKQPVLRIASKAIQKVRLQGYWALNNLVEDRAKFKVKTEAGIIKFGNPVTRKIIEYLTSGPTQLAAMTGIPSADLLNAIDILFVAGWIIPVDPPTTDPTTAMLLNARYAQQDILINGSAGKHGGIMLPQITSKRNQHQFHQQLGLII